MNLPPVTANVELNFDLVAALTVLTCR